MEGYYSIDSSKLTAVEYAVQMRRPDIVDVAGFILADWPEGQEHQDWLDSADVDAIADWVIAGNS